MQIWTKCQRFIDEIRAITSVNELGVTSRARIKFLNDEIRKMMNKREEVSAVVIACCEQNGLGIMTERR